MNPIHDIPTEFEPLSEFMDDPDISEEDFNAVFGILDNAPSQELREQVLHLAAVIKNNEALAEMVKKEEARIRKRRVSLERRIERTLAWMLRLMETAGCERVSGTLHAVRVRTNPPSVPDDLIDRTRLASQYWREWVERAPDKQAIIEAYRRGEEVPGAAVVQTKSIQIR